MEENESVSVGFFFCAAQNSIKQRTGRLGLGPHKSIFVLLNVLFGSRRARVQCSAARTA